MSKYICNYICDCGAHYGSLGALEACQINNHGQARTLCTFGPPSERKRHWILKFEDADKDDMHFDNEAEALAMFQRCTMAWTCTLFVTAQY